MHNFFVSLSLVFLSLFHGNSAHAVIHQVVTPTPIAHVVIASGTLSKYGQTVNFSLDFSQDGGKITGTISGACTGDIHGNYSGGANGELAGSARASCAILFTTFTGNVSFDSKIDLTKTSLDLPIHVVVNGESENVSIPLNLSN